MKSCRILSGFRAQNKIQLQCCCRMMVGVFYLLLFVVVISSCTKDKVQTEYERGSISGTPSTMISVAKELINLGLETYVGQYASMVSCVYNVDIYKVIYYTVDENQQTTKASGLVLIPKVSNKALPLLSYQHGTILDRTDVPSRLKGTYEVGLIFASEGYVVACPDYLGMGEGTGLHPYLHAKTEASAVIDLLRAAKSLCNTKQVSLNNQLFLVGYSQGGHATMAAVKTIEEQFASEFSITAAAPMAGPFDLSGTQLNYILRDVSYPSPGFLPYVLFSYNKVYKLYSDINSVFTAPYNTKFSKYFGNSTTYPLDSVDALWPVSKIPSSVLQSTLVADLKNNENNPIRIALKDNDLYDWSPKSKILMCHCDSDQHVPIANSEIALTHFLANGSTSVELRIPLRKGTHTTCAVPSIIEAMQWFDTLKQ